MFEFAKRMWNCEQNNYSECERPYVQMVFDSIKNAYIHLTAEEDPLMPGTIEIDMDLHLQRRRVSRLMEKVYGDMAKI